MGLHEEQLKAILKTLRRRFRYVGYLDVETFDPQHVRELAVDKDKNHEFVPMKKDGSLWVPGKRTYPGIGWYSYRFITTMMNAPARLTLEQEEEAKKEPKFEVNMMEALMGWKAFCIEDLILRSASQKTEWLPDQPLVAKCTADGDKGCQSPRATCTCGIYGGDRRASAEEYLRHHGILGEPVNNTFLAMVAGWGKYVRHKGGWRAQYAYPQHFYLRQDQELFVPILRKFHVPISVETPFQVYSPEEDGYEHWTQEAYRNRGAAADSAAAEEGSTDDTTA
jgi:hypothetical protein